MTDLLLQYRACGAETRDDYRPKGMWHRTFARHEAQFDQINRQCDRIWAGMMVRLGVLRERL